MTRLLTLTVSGALLISLAGCKTQSVDIKEKTAKVSEAISAVSQTAQSSAAESSVWKPEQESSHASSAVSADPSQQSSKVSSHTEESSGSIFFSVPEEYLDGGIFSDAYEDAYHYLTQMTLDEKIGQMFMSSLPYEEPVETAAEYHLGGYILFGNDFAGKSKDDVKSMLNTLSIAQKVPLAFGVDEEGGTVTRISAKPSLSSHEFESPRTLYKNGGLAYIQSDADEKATLIKELGIDINFAPVCDIATNKKDFMYDRSLGEDAKTTAEFVRVVTQISQVRGVSVTLKHFPGYGQNIDTHTGVAVDKRDMKSFREKDFLPFKAGIDAGAHLVMVSHNIVECMDKKLPASLSPDVHKILRKELGFSGLIITDDLSMGAVTSYSGTNTPAVAAVLAGNDLLILTSDMVESSMSSIKAAVGNGTIDEKLIDHAVFRILAWKYTKGLM